MWFPLLRTESSRANVISPSSLTIAELDENKSLVSYHNMVRMTIDTDEDTDEETFLPFESFHN